MVSASASPNPFTSGSTIAITASVQPGASPEAWCFEWDGCHILWAEPFLTVSGSDGFTDVAFDWTAQWGDPTPGQTLQPTTYTVTGGVHWYVCWGWTFCGAYDDFWESGQTQTSVTPMAIPVPVSASPNSGAGPTQTFSFVYTSAVGASDIQWAAQYISATWTHSCLTSVALSAGQIVLYNDEVTDYTAATLGSAVVLENSQCRVFVGGASTVAAGTSVTVTIPYEFKASYRR